MTYRTIAVFLFTLACFLFGPSPGSAQAVRDEYEKTAQWLATLLNAGRLVIKHNQPVIDDPRRGEKDFTPEVFERQVVEEFFTQSGIHLTRAPSDLPMLARELLFELMRASKQVVADAQLVINQRGIGYKNFIPATFGSQAAHKFSLRSRVKLKQTALNPRNPKNTPDLYETRILQRLAAQPADQLPVVEWTEEGTVLRVVSPIYYSEDCLACHGIPKGILDISGYPREGAQEGEFAGAISVQIPLKGTH
jgi:Protein of unknown function (DUF3365)